MTNSFALKVLIVEDDFSFALDLQMLVEEMGYQCVGIMDSGEKAYELINKKSPDAILMDIDLKGQLSGIELAERLQKKNIPILFITSYKDENTYQRAKSLRMIGFLVKPLNDLTLLTAIDACLRDIPESIKDENLNLLNDSLLIKKGKLFHKVNLEDIYYIKSELEYVSIHTVDDKFIMRESLKKFIDILSSHRFFRSHQSYIINLDYLSSVDMNDSVAILMNDHQAPISRRNRKLIEEQWTKLNQV